TSRRTRPCCPNLISPQPWRAPVRRRRKADGDNVLFSRLQGTAALQVNNAPLRPYRLANSSFPVAGCFLTLRFRGHYLSRTAPAESHTRTYNIGRGVESPAQIVTRIVAEINNWVLDKHVAISHIDIEKAGWRPSKTGRK